MQHNSVILVFVAVLVLGDNALAFQNDNADQAYTIEQKVSRNEAEKIVRTESEFFRQGNRELQRVVHETYEGTKVYDNIAFGPIFRKTDSEGCKLLFDGRGCALGWYDTEGKSMFDTIYSPTVDNLLIHVEGEEQYEYRLLDRAGLDRIEKSGVIATIENRLEQKLNKRKGVIVDRKVYHRNEKRLRCEELTVQLGPDEQEKRYTFYGNEFEPNLKIFEWTVNSKTKLSWIDSETGLGFFMFQDDDLDGICETLELEVRDGDGGQRIELFDVSDPWNIRLVDKDSELFEKAKESYEWADDFLERYAKPKGEAQY